MAKAGLGTLFRRWNTTSGTWVNLAEIKTITGPTMSRETLDTTTLDTTGGDRTFVAGMRTAGTISLNMNFTRDAYETMKDDFESDTEQNYEILLPDDDVTTLEFAGLVTECPLSVPEGLITFDCTIQISGTLSIESGSGSS